MTRWRRAAATVSRHAETYDLGYWSSYDRTMEPVDMHYHRSIHIPLLLIVAQLTGDDGLRQLASRWQGYVHSPISRSRLWATLHARGLKARARSIVGSRS